MPEFRRIKRARGVLFLIGGVLSALSMMGGTALAAGQPLSVSTTMAGGSVNQNINHDRATGWANPNGSPTTVTIEYRKQGESEYKVAGSGSLGSGETVVGIQKTITGFSPEALYEVRTKAQNAYGTVLGSPEIYNTPFWTIKGVSESHQASTASSGTATFEWTVSGTVEKISCSESGGGWLAHTPGTANSQGMTLSGCVRYENGKAVCSPSNSSIVNLDSTFSVQGGIVNFVFPAGCFYGEVHIAVATPLSAEVSNFNKSYNSTQTVTMTGAGSWGGSSVSISLSTTWWLTGEDSGRLFAAASNV